MSEVDAFIKVTVIKQNRIQNMNDFEITDY